MNTSQSQHGGSHDHHDHLPPQPTHTAAVITRRIVITLLLTVVLVPPTAGVYSYFSGVPLHLLAPNLKEKVDTSTSAHPSISLATFLPHSLDVPDEVCSALGIKQREHYSVAVAEVPTSTRPLVLPGSTAFDPSRLARVRARFAPARVVELEQIHAVSEETGISGIREIRQGDSVSKGQMLGIFYSVDVGTKKNDLLDALVQLELDQKILDRVEANRNAVPEVFYLTQLRAVQGDRNAINRALNNLKLWDIPQEEIDALHAEAKKISADKDGWMRTPEGRWVRGDKQEGANGAGNHENPWGRVTLRAPFEGFIVEKNVHVDEMVVDNTVNLFQIADVSRLLVIASCPEDALPTLDSLAGDQRKWVVRTVGVNSIEGVTGNIDEIGYLIDPNQHTAIIKGFVDNPGKHLRAGQFVSATVDIPPPKDAVEIPADCVIDDGRQSVVFVQPDAHISQFTMRRVEVTRRFEKTVFVRKTPFTEEERLTHQETDEGLMPKEPLMPGEHVLLSGALELKAVLFELESRKAEKLRSSKEESPKP